MIRLVQSQEAEAELVAARNYYESKVGGLGDRFITAFTSTIESIRATPDSFARYRRTDLRSVQISGFPYSVFYLHELGTVWIIAVAHHQRRPGYWLSRLPER